MKALIGLILLFVLGGSALAQVFDVDTLQYNGSTSNRINLVIMGDGYTSAEITKFKTDASSIMKGFFSEEPFSRYKNYFNVFIIKVPSLESGANHPGTATDVAEPAHPVQTVNNYFGSKFDAYGIHRLLVMGKTNVALNVLMDNFAYYDIPLMIVNTPYYGGSGGFIAVTSMHSNSIEITRHEIAHSFVGLSDEYWAGDVYAMESLNMTKETNPLLVKWKNWVGINSIGVNQHCCGGSSALWYKPHTNCKMQALNRPFCSVCTQAIIERIHSLVKPIDSYLPLAASVSLLDPVWFKLDMVKPESNTLAIKWTIDGVLIGRNVDSILLDGKGLSVGEHIVRAMVEDTVGLLKIDNHASVHYQAVQWNVSVLPIATQTIDLNDGWNLFSINVHLADSSIETIFKNVAVREVKTFDSFWLSSQDKAFNGLSSIAAGRGYLVKIAGNASVSLRGTQMKEVIHPTVAGWNLVGCVFQSETPFSSFYSAANCEVVKDFDGFWIPQLTGASISLMKPGKAYFMKR